MFDHHSLHNIVSDNLKLIEVLSLLIRRQPIVFVIVDALNEALGQQDFFTMLEILVDKRLKIWHILVSSRLKWAIKENLEPIATATISVEGRKLDDDVSLYIQRRIQEDPIIRKWEKPLKRKVDITLVQGASGM